MSEHEAGAAVSCQGLTKRFQTGDSEVWALRGINLEVYRNQMTLLVGPSGCGKTTLLSVIAAILNPTEGSVAVFDEPLQEMSSGERTRFRRGAVGFVFQEHNLLPSLSARDNVALPLIIAGSSEAADRAEAMLERVGLADRADELPSRLSGGQQQRVAVARALVHEPRLLVCDEPTASLDTETGGSVMELLRENGVAEDRATLVVTHDQRLFHFADRIAFMEDGRIDHLEDSPSYQPEDESEPASAP